MVLRWGLLAAASITDVVVRSCRDSDSVRFMAVASRSLPRAENYARIHGIPSAVGSYEALLTDPEIDAVYVAVPNGLHVEWSRAALEAGKHVLCEKPIARYPEQLQRLYEEARMRNLLFAEAFQYRHHPQTGAILDLVRAKALGDVALILSSHSFLMPVDEYERRLAQELDAGALMDLGCYSVGMARLIAESDPVSVYGEQVKHATGVDVRFAGTMRFGSGTLAQFDCAMDTQLRNRLEVVGTKATLFVDEPWHCTASSIELRSDGAPTHRIDVPRADPYRLEFEAFARAVAGEDVPGFEEDAAIAQARMLSALYESASTGRSVSVSP